MHIVQHIYIILQHLVYLHCVIRSVSYRHTKRTGQRPSGKGRARCAVQWRVYLPNSRHGA
uniref:Uncharacterized protein n=1 Tax=Siphoviridae sp. ct96x5 TaxID=2825367 RepID=A0A8S5PST7_9CAUD|nr:MAG TPA: hypothetical protein [Siphoviridae sp. ct96x5]